MAVQRLQKELRLLSKDPLPFITAKPDPKNLLAWHYCLTGDGSSDFAGGQYHGKITFPSQYPFRPPAIVMVTPSGRFQSNTRLCLSMSDYHPETWNPSWSVASILAGLQSFFYESTQTTGSVRSSSSERKNLAQLSQGFNAKNPTFRKVFTELVVVDKENERNEANNETPGSVNLNAIKKKSREGLLLALNALLAVLAVLAYRAASNT